ADLAIVVDQTSQKVTRNPVIKLKRVSNQLPASFAQQRLWFIDQMDGNSVQYNMPGVMSFNGVFDATIVEQVFARIIARHEPLRTVFANSDEGPRQIIRANFDFKLTTLDLTELGVDAQQTAVEKAVRQDANGAFNLSEDLMLRSTFIRLSANEGVLLFNMHHIASDGWSMALLMNEFWAQYDAILKGGPDPYQPLSIQYADYAQWQQTLFAKEAFVTQLDYWDKQLSGVPLIHDLPLDHNRPKEQGFDGGRVLFEVNQGTLDGLKSIALSANATLFMVLHGAFSLLLSRHSNTNDIVVGVPVANRMQQALEPIIGLFVNTLVLRVDCANNPCFSDYLAAVKQVNLDAQANQDVPFEQLVERLQPSRSTAHSPLFQIMFSMNTNDMPTLERDDLILSELPSDHAQVVAKFELLLNAVETENGLSFSFVYNRSLFESSTIERLGAHLTRLLEVIVANGQQPI
ncbi:MAG: condensation domain-containing protein, partial [Psychrosphaera sp.]|nr:condensation domain-containing protein [Psychrosphaera sp.]